MLISHQAADLCDKILNSARVVIHLFGSKMLICDLAE